MSDALKNEVLIRSFPLFSNGAHEAIDRLAIIVQLVDEMDEQEKQACIGYLAARFDWQPR